MVQPCRREGRSRRSNAQKMELLQQELVTGKRKRGPEDQTKGRAAVRQRVMPALPGETQQGQDLQDLHGRVAQRLGQLRDWANEWPTAERPCTTVGRRRMVRKQPDDIGTVVMSSGDYMVVANPPKYVAPRIRVLEKNLVVDHAMLCREKAEFTTLSIEDWCSIASVEPDSKGLGPTQETLAAGVNASSFTLCLVNQKSRQVIGYIYVGFKPDASQLIISHVKVDAAERGKGLGTLLIKAAERHAKGRGWNYNLCKLEVMEHNVAAKHCYARSGFRHIKTGKRTHAGCSFRWELWRKVSA